MCISRPLCNFTIHRVFVKNLSSQTARIKKKFKPKKSTIKKKKKKIKTFEPCRLRRRTNPTSGGWPRSPSGARAWALPPRNVGWVLAPIPNPSSASGIYIFFSCACFIFRALFFFAFGRLILNGKPPPPVHANRLPMLNFEPALCNFESLETTERPAADT
jgi:hypothetical protein